MTNRILYAGIGSRETPEDILDIMSKIGKDFYNKGYILRSGKAKGADQAFEQFVPKLKEIFTAQDAEGREDWLDHASKYHPAWDRCSRFAQLLHARNSAIILGDQLNEPVEFVVCWTKGGKLQGGTAQGMRIALDNNIPIFNLFNGTAELRNYINE